MLHQYIQHIAISRSQRSIKVLPGLFGPLARHDILVNQNGIIELGFGQSQISRLFKVFQCFARVSRQAKTALKMHEAQFI